ncbi:hypothetical protein [Mucilaginibacter gotjawali]|nr:hypothetical protein [Mucilaginibacter gotjawali]MBB3054284.1 hypothetical protein [Mucilaginibacter gotjawali]
MKILKSLNNIQKAKLLHDLFSDEIPDFLKFLKGECENIKSNAMQIKADWKSNLFTAERWINLPAQTFQTIEKHQNDLQNSGYLFSEQLFSGFGAAFLSHHLWQYTETKEYTVPKFKIAVDLFINP